METETHTALHDVASALVYSLAADHADPSRPEQGRPYNDITGFVLRQRGRLAGGLREALAAASFCFDGAGLLRGDLFHRQGPAARARQVAAWKRSPLGLGRDLMRFYESLVVFALHSREHLRPGRETEAGVQAPGVLGEPPGELRCEIAVVGSGPGGSITAALLAEAGRDVVLVEEGPYLPLESCAPFSLREMEQKYRNGGVTLALGRTKVAYVEGRCVGGGSEINSGLYHRTPPEVLDAWKREFGAEALGEGDLRPHFEACEHEVCVSALPVAAPGASLKLHEGASRLGWTSIEVPRWFRYDPAAPGQAPRGTRQSMTRTFVPRFLAAGGRLVPGTRVDSLVRDGSRWRLRASRESGGSVLVVAETVFCCGGAVQTPALLRRSGLGRHAGDSLRLHPTSKLVARFPEEVNSEDMGVPVHQVKQFAPRLSLGCSISTAPHLALGLLDHPGMPRKVADDWRHMAIYYAMITGAGRGCVRTIPGVRAPLVRYRLAPSDLHDLGEGLGKLAEAMFAAGATEVFPAFQGAAPLRGPDGARRLPESFPLGSTGLMTIHLFSSCPMGERADRCTADSFGRVHGARGLFIADASLLCTAPGVNPQGTIMALARRNALHFLGRL